MAFAPRDGDYKYVRAVQRHLEDTVVVTGLPCISAVHSCGRGALSTDGTALAAVFAATTEGTYATKIM